MERRMRDVENRQSLHDERLANHIANDKRTHDDLEERLEGMYNRRIVPLQERVDRIWTQYSRNSGFFAGMMCMASIAGAVVAFGIEWAWKVAIGS